MSIDCHARVFQTLNDLCDRQSQEVRWKHIQKNLTRPWATAGRSSEAAIIPGRVCGTIPVPGGPARPPWPHPGW